MAAHICETCKNKGKRCYCAPNSTCEGYIKWTITNFEKFKSMNIDELAEWFDKYGQFDGSPWSEWWDATYCKHCEPLKAFVPHLDGEHEFAWCELHDKCMFFPEFDEVPDNKEMIKMWLESEI